MKFRIKKYIFIPLMIIIVVILFWINISAGNNDMDTFIKTQKITINLMDKIGTNSIYAQFYLVEKCNEIKETNRSVAIEHAKNKILTDLSLLNYAKKNGIVVSENEIEKHMKNLITNTKLAPEYKEIDGICKNNNIEFEKTVFGNPKYYMCELIKNKIYSIKYTDYLKANTLYLKGKKESEVSELWNIEWNDFLENNKKNFIKSEKGRKVNIFLKKAITQLKKHPLSVSEIDTFDIKFEGN